MSRCASTSRPSPSLRSIDKPARKAPGDNDDDDAAPRSLPSFKASARPPKTPEEHTRHRAALKQRFPDGWSPPRKLSREAMDGIRALHAHDRAAFATPVLAARFRVSPEAIRRILKSTWVPAREERARLLARERRRKAEHIARRRESERCEGVRRAGGRLEAARRRRDEGAVPALPISRRRPPPPS